MLKLEFPVIRYFSICIGPSRLSSHSFVSEQKHEFKPLIKLSGHGYSNGSLVALMSQLIKSEDLLILLFWVCLQSYCYHHVYCSGRNDLG